MGKDRWNHAQRIIEELLLEPEEERPRLLDRACGSEPRLRSLVQALLASHDGSAGDAADHSADRPSSIDRDGVTVAVEPAVPLSEGPGTKIGRYKILEEIGTGS